MHVDVSSFPVELWLVEDIHPYPFNNKRHPEKQISDLARSIAAQGVIDPIAVDEKGVIVSGHGRLEAIKRLKRTHAPVRVLKGLSEAELTALRIAANKTVSTEYDDDMLAHELSRLADLNFDLGVIGMSITEVDDLIGSIETIDVSEFEAEPAPPKPPAPKRKVKLGKAFGFDAISDEAADQVRSFMSEVEGSTGMEGAEALLAHISEYLENCHE